MVQFNVAVDENTTPNDTNIAKWPDRAEFTNVPGSIPVSE